MGKSGKKSKSDKINALRKQYDAFLEEDKNRKDRNEYILGRMETMRSNTALVHMSSKAYPKSEECNLVPPKYKSTMAHLSNSTIGFSDRTLTALNHLNKKYDEPSLLKEIRKKYLLIPKVTSNDLYKVNYKENYRDPITTDDSDWKSKYNILEELKREEKEDQTNTSIYEKQNKLDDPYVDNKNAEYIPQESNEKLNAQSNSTLNLELTASKLQTDKFSNKELSYIDSEIKPNQNKEKQADQPINCENVRENDLYMKKQELVPQNKLHEVNLSAHSPLPKISQVENNIKQDTKIISTNNKINEIKELNKLREEKLTSEKEPIEVLENNKYLPKEKNRVEFNESQDNTIHDTLNNANNNLSPIVTIENTMELNNENTMEKNNKNNAFSVKNIKSNQEFIHIENRVRAQGVYEEVAGHLQDDPAIEITGHQEYQLQESDLNQIKKGEQNVTSEVNDELETEQKEMFYTEDNDKNNEYNENVDATAYSAENENYVKEYSYYDESQKEQIYPTEINEHEESTERYDPNYEQQYVTNYDNTMNTIKYQPEQYNVENSYDQQQNMYDQQQVDVNYQPEKPNYEYAREESVKDSELNENVYYTNSPQENAQYEAQQLENSEVVDQQNIAYTTSEDYDAQQEYITIHAKSLQIESVEQQLDIEDGYIPNSNIVAENEDYQEQVIEETAPEIQETDIKVT